MCLGGGGFLGYRTLSAKTRKVPGKPGQVGHPRDEESKVQRNDLPHMIP